MEIKDILYDSRSECFSVLTNINVKDYLSFVKEAYDEKGNLEGQRDALDTTTAKRIRRRMTSDLEHGAVFPPVVVGIVLDEKIFTDIVNKLKGDQEVILEDIKKAISEFKPSEATSKKEESVATTATAIADSETPLVEKEKEQDFNLIKVSIIDGMQRTTAFIETLSKIEGKIIRVEFWLAKKIEGLTYRMLVLNTGQAPWNLRRQIEVIFNPLIKAIKKTLIEKHTALSNKVIFSRVDDKDNRSVSGVYHANQIIEGYISFSLRKEKVDNQTVLADEFSRLDMIDAQSNSDFILVFTEMLSYLCRLDLAFSEVVYKIEQKNKKFSTGKNIFDSHPARIGFFTATSQKIYGVAGTEKPKDVQEKAIETIKNKLNSLIEYIETIKDDQQKAEKFFSFDILNSAYEKMPTNKIGDSQRIFFTRAFRLLIDEDLENSSLEPLWRV